MTKWSCFFVSYFESLYVQAFILRRIFVDANFTLLPQKI